VADENFIMGADGRGGLGRGCAPPQKKKNFYLKKWVLVHSRITFYVYAKIGQVNRGRPPSPPPNLPLRSIGSIYGITGVSVLPLFRTKLKMKNLLSSAVLSLNRGDLRRLNITVKPFSVRNPSRTPLGKLTTLSQRFRSAIAKICGTHA